MSLLRNSDVLLYHPLDDATEYTKNHAWDDTRFNMEFTEGIVSDAMTRTNAAQPLAALQESLADGGYTDIKGAERFTVCVWAGGFYQFGFGTKAITIGYDSKTGTNNAIILNKSTFALSFTLKIRNTIVGTKTISIKPTTSAWHFAVIDVEKEGTDWRFRISFNGEDWQDLGTDTYDFTPDSNVIGLIHTSDSSSASSFRIDEVVVWKDAELFTSTELSNLYELANTYGLPMQEYTNVFSFPELPGPLESIVACNVSADLFIHGRTSHFASGSLFIQGHIPSPPYEPMRIIHHLVKTGDYNPQLLGSLTGTPISVNIQVYDITNAQNTLVVVTDSSCYAIGNTGKWGWSTVNLPFAQQRNKHHYYYRMVSNEDETAEGEFSITAP